MTSDSKVVVNATEEDLELGLVTQTSGGECAGRE